MNTEIVRAPWCKMTVLGLKIERMPSQAEWESTGTQIAGWRRMIHFWLGDWACAGEESFGEEAYTFIDDLAEKFGFDPHTIMNDRAVCRSIAYQRRRPGLSFAHHAAVSRLEPDKQDEMLRKAEAEKLTSPALRDVIRGQGPSDMRDPMPLLRDAISSANKAQALAHGKAKAAIGNGIAALEDAAGMLKSAPTGAAVLQTATAG